MLSRLLRSAALIACLLTLLPGLVCADTFRIGIMQAQAGAAKKYAPLEAYLNKKDLHVKFVPINSYDEAADLFAKGDVDGMFSGSGVAGALLIKDVATPLVRPVDTQGRSTYWAVVVAPKGSTPFDGSAAWFDGKRVAFSANASSGEFYYRSLPGIDKIKAQTIVAANHQDALDRVSRGEADAAIIKNMVWDSLQSKYAGMEKVGQDGGQNPNETLIVSKKTSPETLKKTLNALLAVGRDPEATAVRDGMGINSFILTTSNDFAHTLGLLRRAGVTAQTKL